MLHTLLRLFLFSAISVEIWTSHDGTRAQVRLVWFCPFTGTTLGESAWVSGVLK